LVDQEIGYSNTMDLTSWILFGITLSLAGVGMLYGLGILVTGRATRGDRRAFRRLADAGLFYLSFGSALALLSLGGLWSRHGQTLLAGATLIVTVVLIGLVIRYRPRRARRQ
jgi:hypothetical protein